ncbi:hypothetical protein LTR10_019877 [Elasticomyces elasticus]|uniref:Uncharacterized protein n=1 Tax=Exophiala sideris TaxID=1016849 RepID=A0ABR0IZ28_9EURO|nr:hypothetical protein LTR10_019877 [Elasticomyces elasticus]KAK5022399.1 hypothetical protein LTS07_010059 [Exophiala sideris]KAK5027243.1 hypothetical protein LTR13_009638 [Exophiala sideris]KAK5051253.1 hypothetical protein LTR69_010279 [Exophiala sideris]KAK5177783.1 hypothetical protein LTR44_009758 [Eurotiomycetes sp. CCFEE 6388]
MSPSPPPIRRFQPEPLETTIRSTRRANGSAKSPSSSPGPDKLQSSNPESMAPQTKPRRFLPEPVEETVRRSRKQNVEHVEDPMDIDQPTGSSSQHTQYSHFDDPTLPGVPNSRPLATRRRFAPEPIEITTHSSRRRFVPEPIETSTRTSKDKEKPQDESASKPRRRFVPEPVETSTRSNRDKKLEDAENARPRRKFAPEPIETTSTSRRRRDTDSDNPGEEPTTGNSITSSRSSSGPRKWQPELLETAKGSYRRVRPPSPVETQAPLPTRPPPAPLLNAGGVDDEPRLEESRFSAAALARRNPEAQRQHSFQVPDLPMIESTTEEDETETPSLSDSPSSIEAENLRKDNNRTPAAQDSYTEYVLRLSAETVTEKELQEQAMAAYINERPHEPVDHFAIEEDEDGPLPVPMFLGEKGTDARTFRRSSVAELTLELEGMRKHHERLEKGRQELKADTAGTSRFSAAALATRHKLEVQSVKKPKKPRALDEETELAKMMAAATPPMLGKDLVFPYTISPKMTRCDPDQPPRPRNSEDGHAEVCPGSPHLWVSDTRPNLDTGAGLWMGMCQGGMWQPSSAQNGLRSGLQTPAPQTPAREMHNPFEAMFSGTSSTPGRGTLTPAIRRRPVSGISFLPLTPPRSQDGDDFTNTIDKKLHLEKKIEEEFPARVITQIYNYLSLGYPSLAHMFDEELSKISRVPLEELRKDDYLVDAKGYVGAPEGDGAEESEVVGGKCKRWEALRLYVHEWARQSPNFADDRRRAALGANEDWGARARKGSWGQ